MLYFGILCIALWIKLKDGVGLSNGSSHWACPSDDGVNPWASRQLLLRCRRFTADFSCVFKVWSGERSGGQNQETFPVQPLFTCSGPRTNMLATSSVPKFLLVSLIGSLKFNPKGDAILFVSGDFWVQKKMFKILIYQKSKPKSYNFKVDAK